jgi:uncharacterized sulfatase
MTHGDPARGGRHGDAGLTIGREGLQPVLDFMDGAVTQKKPFYIWYAPMMPHEPHNPPKRFLAHYRDKAPSLFVARYWAMCEWFDETCGQLLDHLESKGVADNTLVIYLADNGWIQARDHSGFAPRSKRSPYDGGIRTPILLRWRGKIRPEVCDIPMHSIDLAPTILAAAGLKPTREMEGVNLLDRKAVEDRKAIFGEVFTHNAVDVNDPAANLEYLWAIEDGWKLIVPDKRNVPDGTVELFDLAHDPEETKNRAKEQPERVARLKKLLNARWPAGSRH